MIGAAKKYMIPAYRGASNDIGKVEMCDVGTNVVLACDNPNITITIDEEKSKQSTIVFEVKSGLSLLSGNAVIARLNESGEIDWSWHLWFVPKLTIDTSNDYIDLGSNELSIGGVGTETMPDGKTMMKHLNPYRTSARTEKVVLDLHKGNHEVILRSYNRFEDNVVAGFALSDAQNVYRKRLTLPHMLDKGDIHVGVSPLDIPSPHTDCGLHNLRLRLMK